MEISVNRVNNGIYDVHVISDDEYIGPMIARGHEWDRWMRRDVRRWHVPGTEILDIGANIGYNTMMFSDYGPVVAFEPVFHKIVELNVKSNALRYGVQVIPCALSDEKTVSTIHIPSRGCESNTLINYGGASFNLGDDMRGEGINATQFNKVTDSSNLPLEAYFDQTALFPMEGIYQQDFELFWLSIKRSQKRKSRARNTFGQPAYRPLGKPGVSLQQRCRLKQTAHRGFGPGANMANNLARRDASHFTTNLNGLLGHQAI